MNKDYILGELLIYLDYLNKNDTFNKLKVICRTSSKELLEALVNTCDVVKLRDYLNDKAKKEAEKIWPTKNNI